MIGNYDDVTARWGNPDEPVVLSPAAREFLTREVGAPRNTPQVPRERITVNPSRLSGEQLERLRSILGAANVTTDDDARLVHSGGFSYLDLIERRGDHPQVPDAVVYPSTHEQVQELINTCVDLGVPLVPFGGGTSVVGGVRPEDGGRGGVIAVGFGNMAEVIDFDEVDMTVTVGPGITGPTLERLLSIRGLTLGHFPQSWERATIGGYVATRSSGQASAGYGRSDEMVERLRVATPRGEFRLGRAPGTAAGPDLRQLFIGSEGVLGVITEVTLRVRRKPITRRFEGVMFPTYEAGLRAFRELVARQAKPDLMRLSDPQETLTNLTMSLSGTKAVALERYMKMRKVHGGSLAIFGWEGNRTQVNSRRDESWRVIRSCGGVSLGRPVGNAWEHARFSGPYLRDTLLDNGYLVETLETATGWRELPKLRTDVYSALKSALGGRAWVMSHLSHVYDTGGSLYVTVVASRDDERAVDQWQAAKSAACEAIVANSATITHHHAVGRDHKAWLAAEIGDNGVDLLRAVKTYLDPDGILNPGALLPNEG